MKEGRIMALIIITIVAVIMEILGLYQFFKKESPVGFYNVIAPPKKEEISDVTKWNKKHGLIWIVYGICIEAAFLSGCIMTIEVLQMLFMLGGVLLPIPFMVMRHKKLEKEYIIRIEK